MEPQKFRRGCFIAWLVMLVCFVTFYLVAHEQLAVRCSGIETATAQQPTGALATGTTVEQKFLPSENILSSLIVAGEPGVHACFTYQLFQNDKLLYEGAFETDDGATQLITTPIALPSADMVTLRLIACEGNQAGFWIGNSVDLARTEVRLELTDETRMSLNGAPVLGMLSLRAVSYTDLAYARIYPYFAGLFLLMMAAYFLYLIRCNRNGKATLGLKLLNGLIGYRFLIEQMVSRDFKTKYKRSVLGVFWSFLNPLLTMSVQYVVFSAIFKSNIPNFPVYLMTGIVCFNFFSEACSLGLTSVSGNAQLITKVYIPKYIFPITRVLSSGINFLFSLIPLMLVVIISGLPITPALLLLPFGMLCLLAFSLGMVLLLSTMMVFFRDTQFLWNVLNMLWMYATPLFYPENIIPLPFMPIMKLNPMYHIIRFMRSILIDGISPEPKAYLLCLLVSFVPLALGAWVFKRKQDRFVLYL